MDTDHVHVRAAMVEYPAKRIDYREQGSGPTTLFVPGSWSTGAMWRGVIALLGDRFRAVTTSLLGYGDTEERRTPERQQPTPAQADCSCSMAMAETRLTVGTVAFRHKYSQGGD